MRYWLVKSEPDVFSFSDQLALGPQGEEWHGIRNYQARNNMRQMVPGDRALFYHSNIGKEIVGVAEVISLSHPDSTTEDPRWDCVDMRALFALPHPVTLLACKAEPRLAEMALVKNTRLSVQPVTAAEWAVVFELAGMDGAANPGHSAE